VRTTFEVGRLSLADDHGRKGHREGNRRGSNGDFTFGSLLPHDPKPATPWDHSRRALPGSLFNREVAGATHVPNPQRPQALMHRECIKCISSAKTFPETNLLQKHTKSMTSPATLQGFAATSAGARWRNAPYAPSEKKAQFGVFAIPRISARALVS
jgi:hypothetical protein